MPRKSDSQHENKGHGQKADRGQRGGKMDDFRQQGRQDGSGKRDDLRQQGRQEGSTNLEDFQQQNQQERPGDMGDLRGYRRLLQRARNLGQGKELGQGTAKNGCLPGCLSRLFMLAMPFIALGAYLLVRS